MPKLAFKRKSADETTSLSAYLPTQMVDYTSLPPIEDDTARTRFGRMPLVARMAAVLLPLILLSAAGWGIWTYFAPAPPPVAAQAPPKPELIALEARVVSGSAIAVEAQISNLADGAPGSAQLLADGKPVAWAADSTGTIANGKLTLRLSRAESNGVVLDPATQYVVAVSAGEAERAVTGEAPLDVPEKLRSAFFAAPVAEAPTAQPTPTAEPTPEPTAEPTPAPSVAPGPATLEVVVRSTMLISPTLGTASVAAVDAGTHFEPLFRSPDNHWFLVQSDSAVGWLSNQSVKMDGAAQAQVALITPDAGAVAAGPNFAVVGNGGNIRYQPDKATGTVLGQLHAGQRITLKAQTPDGQWFRVVAPEAEGWVSITLLEVSDVTLAQVPVTK